MRGGRPREAMAAWLFLLPNLLGFLAFTAFPVAAVFAMAFFEGDFAVRRGAGGGVSVRAEWVGLDQFRHLARDPDFGRAVSNTVYLMGAIPVAVGCSLGLALLLNRKRRGVKLFRTLLFLPTIFSGIALFLIWRSLLNPEFGMVNRLLAVVGIDGPAWLTDPAWAKPALMLMGVWIGMGGYNMVLFLAGLQDIDPALYEAAALDGANRWRQFLHVTWPQLAPTTFFVLTTNVIGGFQAFDAPYIMTGGGPEGATTTVVFYIYMNLYRFSRPGYAAAVAIALFAMIFAVTLANWKVGKRVAQTAA